MADEVIEGYRVVNTIATGQNSQVLEVEELSSHRHFAMKIILWEKRADKAVRKNLEYEAIVGKELSHPNIVKIHKAVALTKPDKIPFFVMEFFPAGNLKLRIQRKLTDFLVQHGTRILKEAAKALGYMHTAGWIHRDIKPENLMVNAAGTVKIIDFALARHIQSDSFLARLFHRRPRYVAGTRTYMSPEQIMGQPLDGRSDIYNLGITAYELGALRPPFRAATQRDLLAKQLKEVPPTPQVYNAELTDEFCKLVMRMIAKKRTERPQTCHEVIKELSNLRVFKSEKVEPKEEY